MTNILEVDFSYIHPEVGEVFVEALYTVQPSMSPFGDSDWDYNGFQDLEHYSVWQGNQQILIDIPEDVMYHHLREKMRDLEILGCYCKENGEI